MKKVLTVIVPSYNVENYIKKCLDSFIHPLIRENVEVLVINDGSTDDTLTIASKYQQIYSDMISVITKENGGHGSTINLGLQLATGKYFKVVDGDDWIDQKEFIDFLVKLKQLDSDLIVTPYKTARGEEQEMRIRKVNDFASVEKDKILIFRDICNERYIKMHSMTIKTEVLRMNSQMLDENCFYVDMEYTLYPVPYIETVVFLNNAVYVYRLGLMEQSVNIKSMQKNQEQHLRVINNLLEFYKRYQSKEDAQIEKLKYLQKVIGMMIVSQQKIYLSYPPNLQWKNKIILLDKRMKADYLEVYKQSNNIAIKMLRASNYRLYTLAALILRKVLKS